MAGAPGPAPRVSVILPVRNQADHLPLIAQEFERALTDMGESFEIVLVENGSTDQTEAVCRALAGQSAALRLVIADRPGWGRAVRTGIEAARGEVLCFTNSARTQPKDLTMALRYALVNEMTVVKASRKMRASLPRRVGSLLFNLQARLLFGMAIWDMNGTPKVFHRSLLPVLALSEDGDLLDLEFCVACHEHAIPVLEMPVFAIRRHGGRSTTNWRSAVVIYTRTLWLFWRRRRLAARRSSPRLGVPTEI